MWETGYSESCHCVSRRWWGWLCNAWWKFTDSIIWCWGRGYFPRVCSLKCEWVFNFPPFPCQELGLLVKPFFGGIEVPSLFLKSVWLTGLRSYPFLFCLNLCLVEVCSDHLHFFCKSCRGPNTNCFGIWCTAANTGAAWPQGMNQPLWMASFIDLPNDVEAIWN